MGQRSSRGAGTMGDEPSPTSERIALRKYRNRRYYDATRRLHATLEDIYDLVREGREVQVTDSQTGEDITARVLAQIILEYDPVKLGVFPVDFLHRVIRANEPLIHEFMDRYFSHFLQAYLDSQRQLSDYLRQAMGLGVVPPAVDDWLRTMMAPFRHIMPPEPSRDEGPPQVNGAASSEVAELRKLVQELRGQIQALKGAKSKQA